MFAAQQQRPVGTQPVLSSAPTLVVPPDVFMLIIRTLCDQAPVGGILVPLLKQLFENVGMPYRSVEASSSAELAYELSKLPKAMCVWAVVVGHGNQNGLGFTKGELLDWSKVAELLRDFRTQSLGLASCRAGQYPLKKIFLTLPELHTISASPIKMSPDSEAAFGVELSLIVRRADGLSKDFHDIAWEEVDAERTRRLNLLKDPRCLVAVKLAVERWCGFFDPAFGDVSALAERLKREEQFFERLIPHDPALGREMLITVPFAILLNPILLFTHSLDDVAQSIVLKKHVQKAFEISECSEEVKRLAAEISRAFLPPKDR